MTKWYISRLTIYPYRFIPRITAMILAWAFYGWKLALIILIFTIDENREDGKA